MCRPPPPRLRPSAATPPPPPRPPRLTPPLPLCRYASFVWKFSRTSKVGQRIVGVEMAGALLLRAAAADEERPSSIAADGVPQTLAAAARGARGRRAPNVRAKALSCLATTLDALHSQPGRALLKNVQEPLPVSSPQPAGATPAPRPPRSARPRCRRRRRSAARPAPAPPPPPPRARASQSARRRRRASARTARGGGQSLDLNAVGFTDRVGDDDEASLPALGGMLKDRCADEKATVRRSALSALESWAPPPAC